MDWYLISVVVFVAILAVIFYKDRKNVKRESILLLRKTKRGKSFLVGLGERFPRLWWLYGTFGVIICFIFSAYMVIWLLVMVSQSLVTNVGTPVALVLPSPTTDLVAGSGVVGVPFWYWIISIALLVVVHEGSHGLMAAREKVRIKSLGWGLLAVIPLAFVEPNEEQLAKQKTMKQLRVFAAGSFANFITAIIASFILSMALTSFFAPAGVAYRGVMEGYPAEQVNLTGTITMIDSHEIVTANDLSRVLGEIGPGKQITIKTEALSDSGYMESFFTLTTVEDAENKSKGFIGISMVSNDIRLKDGVEYPEIVYFFTGSSPDFFGLLFFLILINFGVGLFNLLPISILDGGRMWKLVLDRIVPKHSKVLMKSFGTFLVFVLVFMMISSFF